MSKIDPSILKELNAFFEESGANESAEDTINSAFYFIMKTVDPKTIAAFLMVWKEGLIALIDEDNRDEAKRKAKTDEAVRLIFPTEEMKLSVEKALVFFLTFRKMYHKKHGESQGPDPSVN